MADRVTKLRKLNEFRRKMPHVSASALSAILKEIDAHGAPELNTRQAMAAATEQELRQQTPYGSMLTTIPLVGENGEAMSIDAINPLGLLTVAYEQGGSFTRLMDKTWARKPATPDEPWGLILYTDEVVPGNVIKYDNLRKIWVIYFSFQEFGMVVLQHEEAWFTLAVARSSKVSEADAGISQVLGGAIKLFFGALGANMSTGGIALRRADGSQMRLWAVLQVAVQDGGAHKMVWHCKAAADNGLGQLIYPRT